MGYLNLDTAGPLTMRSGFNDFSCFLVHTIMDAKLVINNTLIKIALQYDQVSEAELQCIVDTTKAILLIALSSDNFLYSEKQTIWHQLFLMREEGTFHEAHAILLRHHTLSQCKDLSDDIDTLQTNIDLHRIGDAFEAQQYDSIKELTPFTPPDNGKIPVCITKTMYLIHQQARYIPEHICEDPTYGDFTRLLALVNRVPVRKSTMNRVLGAIYKVIAFIVWICIDFSVYIFKKYTFKGILW